MHESTIIVDCPHASRCSGCAFIGRTYAEQLLYKERALASAIGRYGELTGVDVTPAVAADPVVAYRLRAKLVVAGRSLGLFAAGGHDVVDIPECRMLSPAVARVVSAIRGALPLPFELDAIDAREVDRGVLLTLIVTEDANQARVLEAAAMLRRREPAIAGVAIGRKAKNSPRVLGSTPTHALGARAAPHRLAPGDPFHEATFGSFVQAHGGQASRLYAAVEQLLANALGGLPGKPVLELYAGAGALALRLAKAGARVTAVESYEPAVRALERAARAQGLSVDAVATSAERALADFRQARAVVIDPPRRGLSRTVRQAIGRLRPDVLAYVSCDPGTLARDLAHFAWLGLRAKRAVPFDMIPLSDSVEALVALEPGAVPSLRVLAECEHFVAVDKPPHVPLSDTEAHGAGLTSLVRRIDGLARAVPLGPVDADMSGVCFFARDPAYERALATPFAQRSVQYVVLLRGVVREKGSIVRPLSGKDTALRTRYRRERVVGTHSLVRAEVDAERPGQVGRHLASIGHPVLGDERDGHAASNRHFIERHGLDRAFLHAARVVFELDARTITVESELPPDLTRVLESLDAG